MRPWLSAVWIDRSGFELEELDLRLLLRRIGEGQDFVEILSGEHLPQDRSARAGSSARAPGECSSGVIADEPVFIVEPIAEERGDLLALEEAQREDGPLAKGWLAVLCRLAQRGGIAGGLSSLPSSRAACFARLVAAAIRISSGCLEPNASGQGRDGGRSSFVRLPTWRPSVWKLPTASAR